MIHDLCVPLPLTTVLEALFALPQHHLSELFYVIEIVI